MQQEKPSTNCRLQKYDGQRPSYSADDQHPSMATVGDVLIADNEQTHRDRMRLITEGGQQRVGLEKVHFNCHNYLAGKTLPPPPKNFEFDEQRRPTQHAPTKEGDDAQRSRFRFRVQFQSRSPVFHFQLCPKAGGDRGQRSFAMEEYEDDQRHSWNKAFCGKGIREWAFWFIVTFLACLTVKDVINLIREYSENPKKSDMNVRFNDTMRVPNMTFCMSRAQAWSHFRVNESDTGEGWAKRVKEQLKNMTEREQFLTQPWELEMTMETYNLVSTLTSMERETTPQGTVNSIQKFHSQQRLGEIRKLAKFWMAEIEQRNVTFDNFLQKVGKETLRSSMQRFQRTTYEEEEVIRTQTMITWLSQMQLCFQPAFDLNNSKPINDQGQFFVMILSHNAEKLSGQQIDCMSVDFHGRPSSSTRFMGSKGVTKDGFTDELCMGMMHEITVEVKARYKMLPNDEEGTACRERAEDVDNEYDCHLRCRMEFIRNVCHCTGPTLSYLVKDENELNKWPLCDYSKCATEASQGQNYSDADCTKKCFRDCEQIRFNVIHEKKGKSLRSDLTTVLLNWGSFEYLTLEQDWVWSATTFISAIGGSIGMWLGLSILSLIQGSTYMYGYVTDNVIKKKRRFSIQETHKESLSEERENKLSVNPLASPFKKPSQTQPTAE
ncbi:hypothetical protein GPALN_012687 [Globodera pallida]|nr:hypothetical protein GPALN_012687 [Globodera pallida]